MQVRTEEEPREIVKEGLQRAQQNLTNVNECQRMSKNLIERQRRGRVRNSVVCDRLRFSFHLVIAAPAAKFIPSSLLTFSHHFIIIFIFIVIFFSAEIIYRATFQLGFFF